MYFSDAYPGLTDEQHRSFADAERRLIRRLIVMGCLGTIVLATTLGLAA